MKNKKIHIILMLLFLSIGVIRAQENNAMGGTASQIQNSVEDAITHWQQGYTTPMRLVGSSRDKNTSIDIGIDTVRYIRHIRQGEKDGVVSFDAHLDLQIPFAIEDGKESTKIHFRGTDLVLVGEGKSRLYVGADLPPITIQENKISLSLNKDSSFVEFDCDGITRIGLTGDFIFNKNFLTPADVKDTSAVKAHFSTEVGDWDDFLLSVTFSKPFKVKGSGDFIFTVTDAIVDFSTQSNAAGFTFPPGYITSFPQGDNNLWTGFALKHLRVEAPDEINKMGESDGNNRAMFSFEANNVLIDEYGLTGSFSAGRAPQADGNKNSGLNFSIDTIGVSIVQSWLVGGIISGAADVPLLKDKKTDKPLHLSVTGQIQYDRATDKVLYRISAETLNKTTFGVPFTDKADITLDNGCSFTIGNDNAERRFGATLLLNGSLNIHADLALMGVRFEGLQLSSLKPHFDWKYFGLQGDLGFTLKGLDVSLTKLALTKENDTTAALDIALRVALMGDNMGIAAVGEVEIPATYQSANNHWEPNGLHIKCIMIDADFSVFHLAGSLTSFDNHTMYGDGFKGSILLDLKTPGFSLEATAYFGKTNYNHTDTYKYWFAQITADISGTPIVLFPPAVMLKSVTGGAYSHMKNASVKPGFNSLELPDVDMPDTSCEIEGIKTSRNYIPDHSVGFGFIAGIGAYIAKDGLVTVGAELEMAFNSHFGLKYVRLGGDATFFSKNGDKGGMVSGKLNSFYDVENKVFQMDINVDVNFVKIIKGDNIYSQLYTAPNTWHFYMGTQAKPCTLTILDALKVRSYFMAGEIPATLPPLNSNLTALFGEKAFSNAGKNASATLRGQGFAFGIELQADCGFGKNKGFIFAYIEVDAGTDALVNFKPDGNDCSGNWRACGQAYAYIDGSAGVRVRKKKYTIISLAAAAALRAEFPRPYYFTGAIAFRYRVLFIKGSISRSFSKGTSCGC